MSVILNPTKFVIEPKKGAVQTSDPAQLSLDITKAKKLVQWKDAISSEEVDGLVKEIIYCFNIIQYWAPRKVEKETGNKIKQNGMYMKNRFSSHLIPAFHRVQSMIETYILHIDELQNGGTYPGFHKSYGPGESEEEDRTKFKNMTVIYGPPEVIERVYGLFDSDNSDSDGDKKYPDIHKSKDSHEKKVDESEIVTTALLYDSPPFDSNF